MAGEFQRVRQDELLKMGFSRPTAAALANAGNSTQVLVINQDDINGILSTLEGYTGGNRSALQSALETAERLSLAMTQLDASERRIAELEGRMEALAKSERDAAAISEMLGRLEFLTQNLRPLEIRMCELEALTCH